jgi:hypothetical protein
LILETKPEKNKSRSFSVGTKLTAENVGTSEKQMEVTALIPAIQQLKNVFRNGCRWRLVVMVVEMLMLGDRHYFAVRSLGIGVLEIGSTHALS